MASQEQRNNNRAAKAVAVAATRPKTQESDWPDAFKAFAGEYDSERYYIHEDPMENHVEWNKRRRILAAGLPACIMVNRG